MQWDPTTETKVESGTSQSKSGTSLNASNNGIFERPSGLEVCLLVVALLLVLPRRHHRPQQPAPTPRAPLEERVGGAVRPELLAQLLVEEEHLKMRMY